MKEENKELEETVNNEEKTEVEVPSLASITEGAFAENLVEEGVEIKEHTPSIQPDSEDALVEAPVTVPINKKIELSDVVAKLERLEKHFEGKLKYDQHKEQTIDKLHHELQKYKDDLIGKLLKPVFMDIIEVIDDLYKMIRALAQKGDLDNPEKLFKVLKEIPDDLEDKLYRHGVEVLELESNIFNPTYQKVLKVLPTSVVDLDKTVQEKIKNGYRFEDKLIRHQMVTVYKYRREATTADKESEAEE